MSQHVTDKQIEDGIVDVIAAAGKPVAIKDLHQDWNGYGDATKRRVSQALGRLYASGNVQKVGDRRVTLRRFQR